MYQRIVCFTFKAEVSEDQIQHHCRDLAQLKTHIPQIVTYAGGRSVVTSVDHEPQWEAVHYLTFATIADIEAYYHHPAHQSFIQHHKDLWDKVFVCNATIE